MKKVNLGIIGLGNQGKIHLYNSLRLKEANVVGVADVSKKALNFAVKNGVKNVYKSYEDLLKNDQIDAVIISLPNFLHLESTTKAAEAGKDILLEKPLGRTVEEGRKIVSGVKRNSVKLMMGHNMRFIPILKKIHNDVLDGSFGDIVFVEATNVSGGPFSSRSDKIGPVPVPSWWFDKELTGGGALLDLGSHLINLLHWYFGEVSDVKSYLGYLFNLDLEDTASCMLKFKNGPMASIKVGWFSKEFIQSIQICGTAKNLSVSIAPSSTISIIWNDMKKKVGWYDHDPNYSEIKYFVKNVLNDEPLHPSEEDGLRDLEVISLAYKNASTYCEENLIEGHKI